MFFWDDLTRHGGAIALVGDDGAVLTYEGLAKAADLFGAEPGQLLLLEIDHSVAAVTAYIGALRRRAPVILVNAGDPIATERMIQRFRPAMHWSPDGGLRRLSASGPPAHPDLAVMLSTSGTTGATKLVRLSARAVHGNACSIADYLAIDGSERAITTLPLGYSYGLSVINSHLAAGASVILNPLSVVDPGFRATLASHRATSLAGVPYTYEMLERSGFLADIPESIRTMTQAGGKLSADRVQAIGESAARRGCRFFVMYGQTEATARMAYLPPDRLADHPDCIGLAVPGGTFDLIDTETGAPAETRGELIYSGPNVMMGYAEEAADLARGHEIERLHTGDIAERTGDLFRIVGRKSRFLKLFGLRLSLDEIEREAAALGHPVTATGTDDLLVLAADDGMTAAARAHVIARYGLPADRVAALEIALPRLPSGKIDYQEIIRRALAEADAAPAGAGALRAFYGSLSAGAPITNEVSFASLGGDSMNYVQATIVIEDVLGFIPADWHLKTLAELEALAPAGTGKRWTRAVEGEMAARCFAISTVVVSHVWYPDLLFGFPVHGGANLLLAIFGFNLFRFRSPLLLGDQPWRIIPPIALRYVLPYYLILLAYSAVAGPDWPTLALISNFVHVSGPAGQMHSFWFMEAMFQATLVVAALFCIPAIRRVFASSAGLAGAALTALMMVPPLFILPLRAHHAIPAHSPDLVLYLVFGGMTLAATKNPLGRALLGLTLIVAAWTLQGALGLSVSAILAVGLALLSVRQISMPFPLALAVRQVARSAIYIYLLAPFSGYAMPALLRLIHVRTTPTLLWGSFFTVLLVGILADLGISQLGDRIGFPWKPSFLRRPASSTAYAE